MPLAWASCGGWWASDVTWVSPKEVIGEGTLCHAFWRRSRFSRARAVLTCPSQRCGMAGNGEGEKSLARKVGGTPMADKGNDPVAIWQTMIGEMEKGFNSFANQAMATPEFSKAVNQAGSAAAGAQK